MNGSKLSKLVRTEPVRKELGGTHPAKTNKKQKSCTQKRERSPMTPYREQKNEATRRERSHKKHEKEENDIKDEQVEKGLGTNALRSERNPQSDKNTKN